MLSLIAIACVALLSLRCVNVLLSESYESHGHNRGHINFI